MKRRKDNPDWPAFTAALLDWYRRVRRDLPWRRTRDPYAIWISEVMLQQTQVATAIPYYERFLARFPDLALLARAPLEEVLKIWQGLGYYSRARNLHAAAREIQARYAGKLPKSAEELINLPGIGLYTAAAVASMAYGEPVPVVDGNVWRVCARILASPDSPEKGKRSAYDLLQTVIPGSDPSSFNQAFMELGSLVCTPRNPDCQSCPVRSFCRAYGQGRVAEFPRLGARRAVPAERWVSLVASARGKVLLRRRPHSGLWGGLWEFPTAKLNDYEKPETGLKRLVASLGLAARSRREAMEPVRHAFSHFRVTLYPFRLETALKRFPSGLLWTSVKRNDRPLPVPHARILQRAFPPGEE